MKRRRTTRAVLLVDHGSRERAANVQLVRIARALRRRLAGRRVAVAHLSLVAPGITEAIDACVARGAREIVVVPYFLAPGRHATRDVPRLARAAAAKHAGLRVHVAGALGVHPGLVDAVCDRVRAAHPRGAPARRWPRSRVPRSDETNPGDAAVSRRARGASRAGSN